MKVLGLGLNLLAAWGLFCAGFACSRCAYVGVLSHSIDMHVRIMSKSAVGVNVSVNDPLYRILQLQFQLHSIILSPLYPEFNKHLRKIASLGKS